MSSNQPPSNLPNSNEHPAQRDARMLRKWFPLSFLLKLMVLILMALALMFAIFYYAAGTEGGTRFLLEKASLETGIDFKYGKGNLRDGLWVLDIHMQATDDLDIDVDKAYVKIGWRAIFSKEVHLRDADINKIIITNRKPPTGDPFEYKEIKLPVNLRFDEAKINAIHYKQVTKEPVIVNNIYASDLTWVDTLVDVGAANLQYADIVNIDDLTGTIDLTGVYPLDAKAIVTVRALEKVYVDPLDVNVVGSLKRTVGTVRSRYNTDKIEGDFVVQGLDDKAPFQAKLRWDDIKIPYLESQNIHLKSGLVTANGITSNIRLRINTDLTAKDIPSGKYQGRAVVADSKLNIESLVATVPEGQLGVTGVLDWSDDFIANLTAKGRGFDIRRAIPKEYEDYKAYAPKTLDGSLGINYQQANANGNMQIKVNLNQRDGEQVNATIVQGKRAAKSKQNAPWYINADWQSLVRRDVPNIGTIISPDGKAKVIVQDGKLSVDADANITELNAAPAGFYDVKMRKNGNVINLPKINYKGIIGDLTGNGSIKLATKTTPLTWQINASTNELLPKAYKQSLPVQRVSGSISANGRMMDITQPINTGSIIDKATKRNQQGQRHDINITASDLEVRLDDSQQNRDIAITGVGDAKIDLFKGELTNFDARFDGQVNTKGAPKGNLSLDAHGTPKHVYLRHLRYGGEAGKLDVSGDVDMRPISNRDAIAWNVTGRFDKFNVGYFIPDNPAVITGDLASKGRWLPNGTSNKNSQLTLSDKLQAFSLKFDGAVDSDKLPAGKLNINANGNASVIKVNQLKYAGVAGSMDVKGEMDLRAKNGRDAIGWDVKGRFDNFVVGYFVPDNPAVLTGDLDTDGRWLLNASKAGNKNTDKPSATAGKLDVFNLKFNGVLDTDKLPAGKLTIDASGNAQKITVKQFKHVGDAGSIDAKGSVDVQNGVAWNISANMQQFNLGYFVADMPSSITGVIDTDGKWADNQQHINISRVNLAGRLKGQALNAVGSLEAKLKLPSDLTSYFEQLKGQDSSTQYHQVNALITQLNADDLVLKWGDNFVTADGDAKNLQTKVNITSLDQLSENLAGKVMGGATITQPAGQALPTIYVDLVGERMALPSLLLRKGRIRGKIVNMANSPSQLVVTAEGLDMAGRSFDKFNAVFDGTEQDHVLSVSLSADEANVSATATGGFDRKAMRWSGVIGKGKVASKYATLQQVQPAQLIAELPLNAGGTANKRAASVQLAAHCWSGDNSTGKLCLRKNLVASPNKGQVDMTLQNVDTSLLAPFMPKDMDWQAKLNGKALVGWQKGESPSVNATLYSDNGKIGLIQDGDARPVAINYKRVSLIAMSVAEGLKLRTDIDTGSGGKGYAEVVVDPYKDPKPISGALVVNELNLAVFKPFFPGMRVLEGNITAAGGIGGTLSKPDFYGNVNLTNGRVAILDMPINFNNINATAKIRGNEAVVDGSFNSGEGTGNLSGTINWQQQLQAKLSVTGDKLLITQPPLLVAEVSPDIDIIVRPSERYVKVQGAVSVPTATIRPPEASEDIITQSEDVVVLDRRLIGNLDEVLAISQPWAIDANIGVDLGDDVNFRGFGAVLPLAGAIEVKQQGQGGMQGVGVVQVSRRTNIDAFGQNLELNYAQIRFNGDIRKPNLSIEAVKEIEGKDVGVRVTGDTANPNIVVFNNAGLTEQQAMNALVTGRISNPSGAQISEQGFKSEVTNNLAAAGLSFGLSGTRGLTNEIGRAFGLQSLTVDASGNSTDTNVNVTGYITPDLYIRYGVGVFNAQSSLSARYQLTRRVYIEATSAAENVVDVVYSWQF